MAKSCRCLADDTTSRRHLLNLRDDRSHTTVTRGNRRISPLVYPRFLWCLIFVSNPAPPAITSVVSLLTRTLRSPSGYSCRTAYNRLLNECQPTGSDIVAANTADPMYLSSITIAVIPALCRSYRCYSSIDALRPRHPFRTLDIVDLSSSATVTSSQSS